MRRNAHELVAFHERFIEVLKTSLIPFGFALVLDGESPYSADVEAVDEAVKVIAEAFVKEARLSSSSLYGPSKLTPPGSFYRHQRSRSTRVSAQVTTRQQI